MGVNPRKLSVLTTLLVLILSASSAGGNNGSASEDLPDLEISSFSATPDKDGGYRIELTVTNRGPTTAGRNDALIWDEWNLLSGNRTRIGKMTIPPLDPGSDHTLEIKWDPVSPDPHRLWALVDRESMVEETTSSNNVASLLVQIPEISSVTSQLDGNVDPGVLGTFLKDVRMKISVIVDLNTETDPELVRIYIEDGKGMQVFVPYQSDGTFRAEMDISDLEEGKNELFINSTFARIPLNKKDFIIEVRELPTWYDSLIDPSHTFEHGENGYHISGYVDIPDLVWSSNVSNASGNVSIHAAKETRDLFLQSKITTDGIANFEITGSINLGISGSESKVRMSGSMRAEDPWAKNEISVSGISDLDDIGFFNGSGRILEKLDDGRDLTVPLDPTLDGSVSMNIELDLFESIGVGGIVDLNLIGNSTEIHSLNRAGFENPITEITSTVNWTSTSTLEEGWMNEGEIDLNYTLNAVDTGLSLIGEEGYLPSIGFGADLEYFGNKTSSVSITREIGHNSAVTMIRNDTRTQISRDNRYRSSPQLEFLEDGSPVVVWTWCESWSTDPIERYSSLTVMASIGDPYGNFMVNGTPIDNSEGSKLHPDLASRMNRTAAVWTRDLDSDPRTVSDTEILISILEDGNWSEPIEVTSNSLSDDQPKVEMDNNGNIWVSWLQDQERPMLRKMEWNTRSWGMAVDIDIPDSEAVITTDMERIEDIIVTISTLDSGNHGRIRAVAVVGEDPIQTGDATLLEITDGIIPDIRINRQTTGDPVISWISVNELKSDVHFLEGSINNENITWSRPLPLTNDQVTRLSHDLLVTENGNSLAYLPGLVPGGNSTLGEEREIFDKDLSGAAEIEEVWYELLGEYERGESVSISADVRNVGLANNKVLSAYLEVIKRNPIDGTLSSTNIDPPQEIRFVERGEIRTVTFTTTLQEHQLAYVVRTSSSWSVFNSTSYIPLPVTSDPRIMDTSLKIHENPLNSTFSVSVKNDGLATEDPLRINILGGTIDIVNGPGFDLPRQELSILNSTVDGLGPGIRRDYDLNITLVPGRNLVYVELVLQDGSMLLDGPMVVDIFPEPHMEIEGPEILKQRGGQLNLTLLIENRGLIDTFPGNETLDIAIELTDSEGMIFLYEETNSSIPPSHSSVNLSVDMPLLNLSQGRYSIKASLKDINGLPFIPLTKTEETKDLFILGEIDLRVSRNPEPEDFGFIGRAFRVFVENPTNRTIPITRLVLYNGVPGDEVIVSENFVTWIGPNSTINTTLPIPLEEGLYLLSIEGTTSSSTDASIPWKEEKRHSISFEFILEKKIIPREEEDEIDMDEVTESILIGSSAIASVILVSALFRKKEEDDEDK